MGDCMKKIALISFMFGKLPEYLPIWLYTCEKNPEVQFFVLTDDTYKGTLPANVSIIPTELEDLRQKISEKVGFDVNLPWGYKLCDYRPAYGIIFEDLLKDFDFWGHCDMDILWGNMAHFLTEEKLNNYDRIYSLGALSIYRNTEEVNNWFRTLDTGPYNNYKYVFTEPDVHWFDEWGPENSRGTSEIIKYNKKRFFLDFECFDINGMKGKFEHALRGADFNKYPNLYVKYDNGCTTVNSGNTEIKEVLYTHFSKRNIKLPEQIKEPFYLVSPGVITNDFKEALKDHILENKKYDLMMLKMRIEKKLKG